MGLKEFWNKTIFPDMIAAKKKKKAEEKALKEEAIAEAEAELKPIKKDIIKEQYKKDEVARLQKTKTGFMDKLAKGFGAEDGKGLNTDEKLNKMLGISNNKDSGENKIYGNANSSLDALGAERKINMIMGDMSADTDKTNKIKEYFKDDKVESRSKKLKAFTEEMSEEDSDDGIDKINAMLGKETKNEKINKFKRMI